jgi:RNA polymerase sigma-70 factor (ECF subfamily)
MLGSLSEAEDAVQEAWLRLNRAEPGEVANLGGWLTTVVARVCLDMLRARKTRRATEGAEQSNDTAESAAAAVRDTRATAEEEAEMADSIGLALLVVLRNLAPAERIAFVLHDMFDLSFDDIAPIVGRSSTAARQLASRARRRVQGKAKLADADLAAQRQLIDQFLTASRNGDLDGLLAVLDPEVVLRADRVQLPAGPGQVIHGAANVARFFSGRAQAARPALVNGKVGVVVAPQGRLLLVLNVSIENGRIAGLEAVSDPDHLAKLELAALG